MQAIESSWKFINPPDFRTELLKIEFAYRECYKSEERMDVVPNLTFIREKINMGHLSPLEHGSITVEIICDRGVSHELVRHRIASFSQESTRYCNYAGKGVTVITPGFWDPASPIFRHTNPNHKQCMDEWLYIQAMIATSYERLIALGASPQEARSVLSNSTKTAIIITQNFRQWRHFFQLRALGTTGKPHPQMLEICVPMLQTFQKEYPPIFDDLC